VVADSDKKVRGGVPDRGGPLRMARLCLSKVIAEATSSQPYRTDASLLLLTLDRCDREMRHLANRICSRTLSWTGCAWKRNPSQLCSPVAGLLPS
jgi:hypothetical protein